MNISSLIKASGKTQSEIAQEVGISQPYVSLIERGERQIGHRHLRKMALCLGVDPAVLRPDLAEAFLLSGDDPQNAGVS